MKKIFILMALISSVINADLIKDRTRLFGEHSVRADYVYFEHKSTLLRCKFDVLYLVNETTHGHIVLTSTFNPLTKEPYYCDAGSVIKVIEKGLISDNENYIQEGIVFHKYEDLIKYKSGKKN